MIPLLLSRRFDDISRPLPRWRWFERVIVALAALLVLAAAAVWSLLWVGVAMSTHAHAHDLWINQGAYKNPAGEWCCGAEDCGVVDKDAVHARPGGYSVVGGVTYGVGVTGNAADGPTRRDEVNDVIPYRQALPSPDGAYWRCKRPDGSPRCFFAPPSGS